MDYQAFVNCEKSLLVAPAGYGKTHTIVECLKHSSGRQLILTHTHAGVASIKDKIKKTTEIKPRQYRVETISSFAQRFVTSFNVDDDMPEQDQDDEFHRFIIQEAASIFSRSQLATVLKNSYAGLFVDEYQDCTPTQHQLVMLMADVLPTHILGDPLQRIFDWEGDWDFVSEIDDNFERFPDLDEPRRWMSEGATPELGKALHRIRKHLEGAKPVDLTQFDTGLDVLEIVEREKYDPNSRYSQHIRALLNNDVLFIDPSSANESSREKFFKNYPPTQLLERFDHPVYFKFAKIVDRIPESGVLPAVIEIAREFYGSKGIARWLNPKGFKSKHNRHESDQVNEIIALIDGYESPASLRPILRKIHKLADMRCFYLWRLRSLLDACDQSFRTHKSVFEAMKTKRANLRYRGRFLDGKSIGTTLLTKGLECDTVAILDAHKFDCPKHLYVAMTRACKKLIIFTENTELFPYKNE